MTLTSIAWTSSFALAEESPTETGKDARSPYRTGLVESLNLSDIENSNESTTNSTAELKGPTSAASTSTDGVQSEKLAMVDEKTPLLEEETADEPAPPLDRSQIPVVKRIASAIVGAIRIVLATLAAPVTYLIASFYDEQGQFGAALPIKRLAWAAFGKRRKSDVPAISIPAKLEPEDEKAQDVPQRIPLQRRSSRYNRSFAASQAPQRPLESSTGDRERSRRTNADGDSPSQHTRSKTSLDEVSESGENPSSPTRPTRIKIMNQDALRHRRHRRAPQDADEPGGKASLRATSLTVDSIKSPTSPSSPSRLTRYPHIATPPRPLVPRRQPSYTSSATVSDAPQKTLILDLDETLIHSMAKGGRMSTGHMVEVKLDSPVGAGGAVIGPQVPILYYVHKRPHCDDFLRKVSKWYNLIIFTASVQEYADPVIDWLELERKYFSARYYRQHCTYRSGAYIKDLSTVEPDLSKVMILDNSPLSYIFHEDNAIPIEGWISDPTDNDLLNLIPFLEGLQYATDVRSLLSLRLGESSV